MATLKLPNGSILEGLTSEDVLMIIREWGKLNTEDDDRRERANRVWSAKEDELLQDLDAQNASDERIADALGRTPAAIATRRSFLKSKKTYENDTDTVPKL